MRPGSEEPGDRQAEQPAELIDHLFRREAGRIVATLTRSLGPAHLELAEEAVQEAMVEALKRWPFHGVPESPGGWLYRVARNRALDHLRRASSFQDKEPQIRRDLALWEGAGGPAGSTTMNAVRFPGELSGDQLRLIFLCCHPELAPDARAALTLKLVCGFGVAEIAHAFLDKESTVAQRLVRAKKTIRDRSLPFDVPAPAELAERVESVLEVLYLMFNEGYASSTSAASERHVRADLCAEALRLTEELGRSSALPEAARPTVHALAALLCFQASRLPARLDDGGELVLLADQDRTLWDHALIRRGFGHLEGSATGPRMTPYHLEAAIASHHAAAPEWQETDWSAIVELYDRLLSLNPSPVVALNRAVALAQAVGAKQGPKQGARAGLAALDDLEAEPAAARLLADYHLLPATRGTLLLQAGRPAEAARALRRALSHSSSPAERRLLEGRLAQAEGLMHRARPKKSSDDP